MKAAICKNYGPIEVLKVEGDHSIIQVHYNEIPHLFKKRRKI